MKIRAKVFSSRCGFGAGGRDPRDARPSLTTSSAMDSSSTAGTGGGWTALPPFFPRLFLRSERLESMDRENSVGESSASRKRPSQGCGAAAFSPATGGVSSFCSTRTRPKRSRNLLVGAQRKV
eukprot:Skav224268  [mRNA]  locus=scaffold2636:239503:241371:+ [translate_table: standard]